MRRKFIVRKMFKTAALALTLAIALSVGAFAASFEHCADKLNELGLLQGTAQGYELDRAPTRAEAAVMLVRLLGQETAAKGMTYSAPFTDVPDWAKPYVQYLYEKGLTSGQTATTFAPGDACTAPQYATFLLRALGYSDKNGDFTYEKVMSFAEDKGVVDYANCNPLNFLRDHVVAMSYTALSVQPKSGEANLLAKLVKDGAVKDAKGLDTLFTTYAAFNKSNEAMGTMTKAHLKGDATVDVKVNGASMITGTLGMDIAMILNMEKLDQSQMALVYNLDLKVDPKLDPTMDPKDAAIKATLNTYYTNGYMYMNDGTQKTKLPMSLEAMLGGLTSMMNQTSSPVCLYKNLQVENKADGTTVYTVELANNSFNGLMDTIMGQMGNVKYELPKLTLGQMKSVITMKGTELIKQSIDCSMGVNIEDQKLDMAMKMDIANVAGEVKITLPTDLNTYTEEKVPATPAA